MSKKTKESRPNVINVTDFAHFVREVKELECRYWVYRGHGKVDWRIEPSLARFLRANGENINCEGHNYTREQDYIRRFQRSAHLHMQHCPEKKRDLSWLAVMQHFGAPTRLVDFSYSPYVALFFAVADAAPNVPYGKKISGSELDKRFGPYEVHAVHLESVKAHAERVLRHEPADVDYHIGAASKQKKSFVSFFEGEWLNPRQVAQQGLFMVPSRIELNIHKILMSCRSYAHGSKSPWQIFRFKGGSGAYKEMVMSLLRANLTAESLFPGLDGLARSLCFKWYEQRLNLP